MVEVVNVLWEVPQSTAAALTTSTGLLNVDFQISKVLGDRLEALLCGSPQVKRGLVIIIPEQQVIWASLVLRSKADALAIA